MYVLAENTTRLRLGVDLLAPSKNRGHGEGRVIKKHPASPDIKDRVFDQRAWRSVVPAMMRGIACLYGIVPYRNVGLVTGGRGHVDECHPLFPWRPRHDITQLAFSS